MVRAGTAEPVSKSQTEWLRVYCSAHNLGFTAPRSGRIKCESGGHELDHDFPYAAFWEYCCDCQHYWLADAGKAIAEHECPACERKITKRFFCGECKIIAVESDSPARRKAYSISSQGTPSPTCPGCLIRPPSTGVDHECPDFGGSFVTSRLVCPFCDAALEAPPSFPCSVSSYVEKLHTQSVTLEFDPALNMLRESNSGDYLLIEKVRGSTLPIVIPRAVKLSSKQDYYQTYYELFNCDNPVAGEIIILSPAIVEKSPDEGWLVREAGFLTIEPERNLHPAESSPQAGVQCSTCGKIGNPEHAFCKSCGTRFNGTSGRQIATDPLTDSRLQSAGPETTPPWAGMEADYESDDLSHTTSASAPTSTTISPIVPVKAVLGVVAVLALLIVVFSIAKLSDRGDSVEKRLDNAIATGILFGPNQSAHDLYDQLKNSGATQASLKSYRDRLLPLLSNAPLQMIDAFLVPGSDDPPLENWQAATQSLNWAAELKPVDSKLLSRAIYCQGRLAYLTKQEDQAIETWTRAAEVDKNWPLPMNGIGLIYTSRKNYAAARSFYFEAIRRDPNWAYPYNNLGTAFHLDKNDYVAKNHYQKAAELAPRWARPHAWLGDLATKEKDFGRAIVEYEAVLDPSALGTRNMDLDKIREKLNKARQQISVLEE